MTAADLTLNFRGVRIALHGDRWTTPEVAKILRDLSAEIEARVDAHRSKAGARKLAILAMFEQVFSVDELEEIAYSKQLLLEIRAADQRIACDAVTQHCSRVVVNSLIRLRDDSRPIQQVEQLERDALIAKGIRRRWSERVSLHAEPVSEGAAS